MKLQVEEDATDDRTIGFATIVDKGKAQQATFDIAKVINMLEMIKDMQKMGYSQVTFTIEDNMPMVIGGKFRGVAVAPRVDTK